MRSVTVPGPGALGGSALTGGVGGSAGEPPLPRSDARPAARTGEERVEALLPRGEDGAEEVLGRLCLVCSSSLRRHRRAGRQRCLRGLPAGQDSAFVPVLVERRARAVLDAAARRHRSAPEERNPLSV
jgi:hypothetical protein